MEKRSEKRNKKRTLLYLIPALLLIGILVFASVRALMIYLPQKTAQDTITELKAIAEASEKEAAEQQQAAGGGQAQSVVRYTELTERNDDFKGWLSIENTLIDYPVLQPKADDDPLFYLRHDFDRQYAIQGSLFVGEDSTIDSDCFIIYGHNMNTNIMFGTLDSYAEESFAYEHPLIKFSTPTEDRYYRVFAAFQTKLNNESDEVFHYYDAAGDLSEKEYTELTANLKRLSVLNVGYMPKYPAQILMLSTCSYHTDNGRFVVAAYREK